MTMETAMHPRKVPVSDLKSKFGHDGPFGNDDPAYQLSAPRLPTGGIVTGGNKKQWKKVTKRRRQQQQLDQPDNVSHWTQYNGLYTQPVTRDVPTGHRGGMCPSNLALQHPAADMLLEYATKGCPVETGRAWTRAEIARAIERGNHPMEESAMNQFCEEARDKQRRGLVRLIKWSDIKDLPDSEFPMATKVSPLSATPHKSRVWRAILDLSWMLKQQRQEEDVVPSVNVSSEKMAPRGAIDQLGHTLKRIIHAVAELHPTARRYTLPNGMFRMVFGKWCVSLAPSGTFVTCSHNQRVLIRSW